MATVTIGPGLVLALGLVKVREAFGHDGRSRGDNQGDSKNDLFHFGLL